MMTILYFYKLAQLSQGRDNPLKSGSQSFLKIILLVTVVLFSAFLATICNEQVGLAISILLLYLSLAYNYDFTLQEFFLDKFRGYGTRNRYNFLLFFYLFLSNNPVVTVAPAYGTVFVLMNMTAPFKLLLLLSALLVVGVLLGTKLLVHSFYKFLGICFAWGSIACLFFDIKLLPTVSFLQTIYMIALIVVVKRSMRFSRLATQQALSHSTHIRGITLYNFVFYNIVTNYKKFVAAVLGSALAGLISCYVLKSDGSSLFLFLVLLDLELLLDKKYKHLNKYISKYYFLYHSGKTLLGRYVLSDSYSASMRGTIYMSVMGIFGRIPLGRIAIQSVVLLLLGLAYHWAEEKMFRKHSKINGMVFQYLTFMVLILTSYLVSFIGG